MIYTMFALRELQLEREGERERDRERVPPRKRKGDTPRAYDFTISQRKYVCSGNSPKARADMATTSMSPLCQF